jgi:glycogen debranching enzyme
MYGHMLRVLHDQGFDVEPLVESATAGLHFILRERKFKTGLVHVVHPWETGADDSPRWAQWCHEGIDTAQWRIEKDRYVKSLIVNGNGAAVANPLFSVAPASFNALVAFNASEIAAFSNDSDLRREALELADALEASFVAELDTWADTAEDGRATSVIRTLDALLPVLVSPRADRIEQVLRLTVDSAAFGAPFGPCGVDQRESVFEADGYWRGSAWPQLTYLFFVAASRARQFDIRDTLADTAIRAAVRSDYAEYLNPISGVGHGASPQSWACLPIVMLPRDDDHSEPT